MQTVTYRLNRPIKTTVRHGAFEYDNVLDEIAFEPFPDGEAEPNLTLVINCARAMTGPDGRTAAVEDLLKLRVTEGVKKAASAAFQLPADATR